MYCKCRIQNPDIPRAGRVGAHGWAAGRGRAGREADRTVCSGNKRPLMFNVELVYEDFDAVVDKLCEVQKEV